MTPQERSDCYANLVEAVRHSLGLDDEVEVLSHTPFVSLDSTISQIDLLEIFKGINISSVQLKPYVNEAHLTESGKLLLKRAGDYEVQQNLYELGSVPHIYALACSENLDELAQRATITDFIILKEYLDYQNNTSSTA